MVDNEHRIRNRIRSAAVILSAVAIGAAVGYYALQIDASGARMSAARQPEPQETAAIAVTGTSGEELLEPEETNIAEENEITGDPAADTDQTGQNTDPVTDAQVGGSEEDTDSEGDDPEEDADSDSGEDEGSGSEEDADSDSGDTEEDADSDDGDSEEETDSEGDEDDAEEDNGSGEDDSYYARDEYEIDDWRLILVNPWHYLPDDFEIETAYTEYGREFDARAVDDLEEMLADCREEGHSPLICSAYRNHDFQVRLFENDVRKWMWKGYSEEEAREETARNVAIPGTSEHEAGLAVDIVYSEMQALDEYQADNETQQWLMEHCWEYGFILRYPEDKTEITGITYEPWHYRYVGKKAAAFIRDNNLCLEEYLDYMSFARHNG